MMILGLILLNFALTMGANCVLAWTMQTLWGWFCASSLGAGPGIGVFWGLAVIASLVISTNIINLQREPKEKSDAYAKPIGVVLGCLLTLAFAWLTGSILGWKA